MRESSEKAKAICAMYKSGLAISQIAKHFNIDVNSVRHYILTHYEKIYNEKAKMFTAKYKERIDELYKEFQKIYIPFVYTRAQLCKMLSCTISELEKMFAVYNLSHLRLNTSKRQRTLCTIPNENYDEYVKFAKKHGFKSVRNFAQVALADFMILHNKEKGENNE